MWLFSQIFVAIVLTAAPSDGRHDDGVPYNTSDVYVVRVCSRAPVLLDPGEPERCRIVDRGCIVDEPCSGPDVLDGLLRTVPCPPSWKPSLICLPDSRMPPTLNCTEKLTVLRSCFLSPNYTYDLTSVESCALKRQCGTWLEGCRDGVSDLNDVFWKCTIDLPTIGDVPSGTGIHTEPSGTGIHTDSGTHPTTRVLVAAGLEPDTAADLLPTYIYDIIAIAVCLGILLPPTSMLVIYMLYRAHRKASYDVKDPEEAVPFNSSQHVECEDIVMAAKDTENIPYIDDSASAPGTPNVVTSSCQNESDKGNERNSGAPRSTKNIGHGASTQEEVVQNGVPLDVKEQDDDIVDDQDNAALLPSVSTTDTSGTDAGTDHKSTPNVMTSSCLDESDKVAEKNSGNVISIKNTNGTSSSDTRNFQNEYVPIPVNVDNVALVQSPMVTDNGTGTTGENLHHETNTDQDPDDKENDPDSTHY